MEKNNHKWYWRLCISILRVISETKTCLYIRYTFQLRSTANDNNRNKFSIFDVPNKLCLLLCLYITILILIFANKVFAISKLTLTEQLFCLRIPSRQKQLELSLKEEIQEMLVFRRCKSTIYRVQISRAKILANFTLRLQIIDLGSVTSIKLQTSSYIFRCNNREALDNNSR